MSNRSARALFTTVVQIGINVNLNDGTTSKTPFAISLPTFTTTVDYGGAPKLMFDAVDTDCNVAELYGAEDGIDYVFKTSDNHVLSYNVLSCIYTVDGEANASFKFGNLAYNGLLDYVDKNGNPIDLIFGSTALSLTAINGDTNYYVTANGTQTRCGAQATLANSNYGPSKEITVDGNYIIDGYYTHYTADDKILNPQKNSDKYLILGGITTDYQISSNDIIVSDSGIVKQLSINNKIFLLMLCLLSVPAMTLFKNFVPWVKKQVKLIKKIIGKI